MSFSISCVLLAKDPCKVSPSEGAVLLQYPLQPNLTLNETMLPLSNLCITCPKQIFYGSTDIMNVLVFQIIFTICGIFGYDPSTKVRNTIYVWRTC